MFFELLTFFASVVISAAKMTGIASVIMLFPLLITIGKMLASESKEDNRQLVAVGTWKKLVITWIILCIILFICSVVVDFGSGIMSLLEPMPTIYFD